MKRHIRTFARITVPVLLGVFLYTGGVNARSINDSLGTSGFSWLKSISDAEISAAGECLAARDTRAGLFVHPAAVAGSDDGTFKMSYISHYVDTQYGSIGYARKLRGRYWGFRMNYVNYGEFVRTNKAGEKTGSFDAGDMGFTVNLGQRLREDLKVGAMASFMTSKIDDFSAQAVSLDLGMLYDTPFEGLSVGAVLMNLGTVTKSYSTAYKDRLPVLLTVGARKKLSHAPFTLYSDVTFPRDNDMVYAFGIEMSIRDIMFLYAGTKSRSVADLNTFKSETDFSGITTFGFGIALNRYRFNYAYLPDDALEDIHKVTVGIKLP
ncbi:PorV/PorQ family protein [bacterium]|nr:PorV/PorQ family protein [bacterium]